MPDKQLHSCFVLLLLYSYVPFTVWCITDPTLFCPRSLHLMSTPPTSNKWLFVFFTATLHKARLVYLHGSCPFCQIQCMHPISSPMWKSVEKIWPLFYLWGSVSRHMGLDMEDNIRLLSAPERKGEGKKENQWVGKRGKEDEWRYREELRDLGCKNMKGKPEKKRKKIKESTPYIISSLERNWRWTNQHV